MEISEILALDRKTFSGKRPLNLLGYKPVRIFYSFHYRYFAGFPSAVVVSPKSHITQVNSLPSPR
jgi:hypothetical protein